MLWCTVETSSLPQIPEVHIPKTNVFQQIPNKNNFSQKMSLEHRKIPTLLGQACRAGES